MTSREQVGPWPEEAAKLLAALQARAQAVHPDVFSHLADAVGSLAAAVRLLAAGPANASDHTDDDAAVDDETGTAR